MLEEIEHDFETLRTLLVDSNVEWSVFLAYFVEIRIAV